jgi:hypothetical protein
MITRHRFEWLYLRPSALVMCLLVLCSWSCERPSPPLTAQGPLHLEEHLDSVRIDGSDVPAEVPSAVEWRFDEPQLDWKPFVQLKPAVSQAQLTRTDDALRVTLTAATDDDEGGALGGIYIDLPWNDHWCLEPVNDEYSDLVEKYTAFLEQQWKSHRALAESFSRQGNLALTPEQLATLRALGYIE